MQRCTWPPATRCGCFATTNASDPGNRCKLRLRHAILMALVHKKDNPTQGVLQAIFGMADDGHSKGGPKGLVIVPGDDGGDVAIL